MSSRVFSPACITHSQDASQGDASNRIQIVRIPARAALSAHKLEWLDY